MKINKSLKFGKFLTVWKSKISKSTKIERFSLLRNSRGISKKSQGLSINVIIIAAISLIVLIVLVFILTGRMGIFGKGLEDCASKGGKGCASDCETDLSYGKGYVGIPGTNCDPKECCIKVLGE